MEPFIWQVLTAPYWSWGEIKLSCVVSLYGLNCVQKALPCFGVGWYRALLSYQFCLRAASCLFLAPPSSSSWVIRGKLLSFLLRTKGFECIRMTVSAIHLQHPWRPLCNPTVRPRWGITQIQCRWRNPCLSIKERPKVAISFPTCAQCGALQILWTTIPINLDHCCFRMMGTVVLNITILLRSKFVGFSSLKHTKWWSHH